MYPRWAAKPPSEEAYGELEDLITELQIIESPVNVKIA